MRISSLIFLKTDPFTDYFQGGGKTLYWDDRLEAIIIDNPANPTAFRAEAGKEYFDIEVNKLKKIEGIK